MMHWFGPADAETLLAETDPRVGGRFRVLMRTANGEEHDVSGVYREVVRHEKLVFTWAWRSTPEWESLVTVALKSDGDGTVLTLTHEQFFDEAARDAHRGGWSEALDKLAASFRLRWYSVERRRSEGADNERNTQRGGNPQNDRRMGGRIPRQEHR
jgi:uncharacterized protein YndB with AHSA1/START domain